MPDDRIARAEARLSDAMALLHEVNNRSWSGHGISGSNERAVAINRAYLDAHSAIVAALRALQATGGSIGPGPHVLQYEIDMWEAEIAKNKRNLLKYGGIPY